MIHITFPADSMLTQRYALYIILSGITFLAAAVGVATGMGFSLLVVLLGFYGVLAIVAGCVMWEYGKRSI